MLIEQTLLFSDPITLQSVLPWVVCAVAVVVLAFIVVKCITMYRNLKSNSKGAIKSENETPLLTIRGEYCVLSCDVEYCVGKDGQLKAGKYLLRGDGYDKFKILLNGEEQELCADETLEFTDGDWIVALDCDVLIKPVQ